MASIKTIPGSDVVGIFGSDIRSGPADMNYEKKLEDFLLGGGFQGVQRGQHDYWVVYTANPPRPGIDIGRPDLEARPRAMRGLVHMGLVPNSITTQTLSNQVATLIHEFAHAWVLPRSLSFNGRGIPETADVARSLNNFGGLPWPPLKGRQHKHWSPYVNVGGSPMDGTDFEEVKKIRQYSEWKSKPPVTTVNFADPVSGTRFVLTPGYDFPPVDRVLMGLDDPNNLPQSGQTLDILNPRLTAPCNYQTGLFIAFAPDSYIYFGPYRDHRQIMVERDDRSVQTALSLDVEYLPTGDWHENALLLRIVRSGDDYYFQVRHENIEHSGFRTGAIPGLFDGLSSVASDPVTGANDRSFVTVAKVSETGSPIAIGAFVKKWGGESIYFQSSFFNFEVTSNSTNKIHSLSSELPIISGSRPDIYSRLNSDTLNFNDPSGFAKIRHMLGKIFVAAPFADVPGGNETFVGVSNNEFDHWSDLPDPIDGAPKLITKAPTDQNFAFGTSCRVEKSILTPFAAASAQNPLKSFWGAKQDILIEDLQIPENSRMFQIRPGTSMRFKFMVIGIRESDFTDGLLQRVETIRQAFGNCLFAATNRDVSVEGVGISSFSTVVPRT